MGKRVRESRRRMCKRPKPSSGSSPGGAGGGGGGQLHTATAQTLPPAGRGTTSTSSTSSSSGGRRSTPPLPPARPAHGMATRSTTRVSSPSPTPPVSSPSPTPPGSSPSPAQPAAIQSPRPAGLSPSTPRSSSAGTYVGGRPVPPFLNRRVNPPTVLSQYDMRYGDAEKLLTYMETKCTALADELWSMGRWHLKICFEDLKMYDRELSYRICNNFEGNKDNNYVGGEAFFAAAMRRFLLDYFKTKNLDGKFATVEALEARLEEHGNFSISAKPKSICRFGDYRNKIKLVNIFAGEWYCLQAIEVADLAKPLLCQLVDQILDQHRKGYCFEGNWSINDWEVINDKYVNLLAKPVSRRGREMSDKDLRQIADSVLPTFAFNGDLPSFMEHFKAELLNLPPTPSGTPPSPDGLSDHDFFGWYYSFLKYHPALMSPLARSNLLQGFYFVMDKLDFGKLNFYNDIFHEIWPVDWRLSFHPPMTGHRVHNGVFWHKQTPTCDITKMPHDNTYGGMLAYHRHLMQHSPDHGRTKQGVQGVRVQQSMTNSDEAELIAYLHNQILLPTFIKNIFTNNMMKGEFAKHFEVYAATRGK